MSIASSLRIGMSVAETHTQSAVNSITFIGYTSRA